MGGPGSGVRGGVRNPWSRAKATPEQKAKWAKSYKERRQAARNSGMCVNCLKRPVAVRSFWWKENTSDRVMKTCEWCMEADYWRSRSRAIAGTWCEECLAFGFHRSHCPNLDTSKDNPVIARLEKKLLDLYREPVLQAGQPVGLVPPHPETGSTHGVGPLLPGIVEDGRPSDEGGPESSPDEIDFPGLPRLKPPPSEAHVVEGKADRSLS